MPSREIKSSLRINPTYEVEIILKDDSNKPEFYEFLHQWLSYDKRIRSFRINEK